MKTRRRLKRFVIGLVLLAALFAGGWTGLWYVVSGRLVAHAAQWEEARRAEGWTIAHAPPRRTGWPMAAAVAFDDLSVQGGRAYLPGGLAWTAGSLTVALDIRHFNHLSLAVSGRESLALGGKPPLAFQARRLTGDLALLPGDRLGLMLASAEGVLAAVPGGVSPQGGTPQGVSLGHLALAARFDGTADAQSSALSLAGTLQDLHLPPSHLAALGDVPDFAFDVAFSGPVPAQAAQSSAEANAAAWSRAGGQMVVNRFRFLQGPLTLNGTGRFTLGPGRLPEGQASVQAEGLDEALARLAARGVMRAPEARSMTAMLGLLGAAQGGGGAIPVSLHDGTVSLGPIPLLRLRP